MARAVYNVPVRIAQWRHDRWGEFVFIHINKTGGSSIEAALGVPLDHHTAEQKVRQLGVPAWNQRFTFSFVRNPWDRTVSHYQFRLDRNHRGLRAAGISFADWVRLAFVDHDPLVRDRDQMFVPQIDWLTDRHGAVLVDRIFRFERLAEDFAEVAATVGVANELPHQKASRRSHYVDYYDDRTVEIVAQAFAPDIKRFGYEFGGNGG